jgi:hypothetical protein
MVPNPVFSLTAGATVDEGNNWVSISWGPLALTAPWRTNLPVGTPLADYSLTASSPAINFITPANSNQTYQAAPADDFFGNLRKTNNAVDAGAIESTATPVAVVNVMPTALTFSAVAGTTTVAQTLTVTNTGGAPFTGMNVVIAAPFARPTAPPAAAPGTCGATLAAASSCTINVVFSPAATASGTLTGSATITGSVAVTGSPVSLTGTVTPRTFTATVTPSPLAFGLWPTGATSAPLTLTVTNTGNSALTGGTFTFGGGAPQPFAHPGTGNGPTNCTATLAVGASCTYRVTFAPATAVAFSRTLTVAYAGATVTGSPVTLTGTGTATRAAVSVTNLTITLPSGAGNITGTGTVTFTNNAAVGGANATVSNVVAAPLNAQYAFTNGALAGPDNCTGAVIAPQTSCTVSVRFTNLLAPRGTNRAGTLTFTDSGSTNPVSTLTGFATP